MSATEVVANMPLHSATVRVNKHKGSARVFAHFGLRPSPWR